VFFGADLILFLTASLALIVTPGPGNLYILARGVTQGRKAALVSAGSMGRRHHAHGLRHGWPLGAAGPVRDRFLRRHSTPGPRTWSTGA